MTTFKYFVGVDVASATFTACAGSSPWQVLVQPATFENDEDGYAIFLNWLKDHHLTVAATVICMEATGVYSEGLAYCLFAAAYTVAVEPPLNIQRKFRATRAKTEEQDSQAIAEYACRYVDQLSRWQPRPEILEQIKVLLTTREQFSSQVTAHKNALQAVKRKKVISTLAQTVHEELLQQLAKHLKAIDVEIRRLIESDPTFKQTLLLLLTIPGVGLLLAAHLLLITQYSLDPRVLAAFVGICPYPHESGTSIYRTPTSRHYGPPALRKLLYLAACSVRTHRQEFRHYFFRKTAAGKAKKLVLNNIENKLLKIACAVLRSQKPFIPNFVSVNPLILKQA